MNRFEYDKGFMAYNNSEPLPRWHTADFDKGWWAAHDASFVETDTGGIEEAYGNFEAIADFWDDDPNPYSGTYSEE